MGAAHLVQDWAPKRWEWPPPTAIAPPEEITDYLVEDQPGAAESRCTGRSNLPDGLLADWLAQGAGRVADRIEQNR